MWPSAVRCSLTAKLVQRGQVEGVHRHRLHRIQRKHVIKIHISALGYASKLFPVLGVALLYKRRYLRAWICAPCQVNSS